MYELRILNGLHRGATLPLDDQPHMIGASEAADVVLVDPGIEEQHATLSLTDSRWVLSALNGGLRAADSNQPQTMMELEPGDFARLGEVWLTVVDQDAPWTNPPPAPVDTLLDTAIPGEEFIDMLAEAASDADQVPAASVDMPEPPPVPAMNAGKGRGARFVYPLAVVTILSAAAAAYAITSKPDTVLTKGADILSKGGARSAGKQGDRTVSAAFDVLNADPGKARALTPDELRKAFRSRLEEVDLSKRFDLSLQDQQWTMQAALDAEEAARFERVLAAFIKTHNITFPVNAKIGNAEAMLPFKIRQVISGANASVVTQDGDRLYVGDECRGVTLLAINGSHLTFAGKRKIEVNW